MKSCAEWISSIYPPGPTLHLSPPFPLIQESDLSGLQVAIPQWFSTGEQFWSPGDIWQYLETFLVVSASNGMLLNTLQKQPPSLPSYGATGPKQCHSFPVEKPCGRRKAMPEILFAWLFSSLQLVASLAWRFLLLTAAWIWNRDTEKGIKLLQRSLNIEFREHKLRCYRTQAGSEWKLCVCVRPSGKQQSKQSLGKNMSLLLPDAQRFQEKPEIQIFQWNLSIFKLATN